MPTLEQIEAEVDELGGPTSNDFRFRDALKDINAAAQVAATDADKLREILSQFREKIPDLIAFNRIRADAKDLADHLMLAGVADRINRIKDRNDTLSSLTSKLQTQINKANSDANLLKKIKDGVEKANKTFVEIKALVDQLQATDATTKQKLKALIERVGNITTIFKPEES
ncbi:MAG TPA: hypothetical protein VGO56_08510 [Pyrinomonadaceae bacterium]|jgi:septation ring formation regulator EzrA|nr:hypothetical protein [Pyrinomonadaceae bacterium]